MKKKNRKNQANHSLNYFFEWLKFSYLTGKLTFWFQTRIFCNTLSRLKFFVMFPQKKIEKIKHNIRLSIFFQFLFYEMVEI